LRINEHEFADYLRQKGYQPNAPNEEQQFDKKQTKELIKAGASPHDYKFVA